MTSALEHPVPAPLRRSAMADLAAGFALVLAAAVGGWIVLDYTGWVLTQSLILYLLLAFTLFAMLRHHLPRERFGAANRVTLLRAALVVLIAGTLGHAGSDQLQTWVVCTVAGVALMLDGIDGWLARRTGMASPFGARFDTEVDALLILVLSLLVWQSGKVGPWVLAAGLMRYGFVAVGLLWPPLRAPLFPSRRRQAVCVLLVLALIAALAPATPPPVALVLAGAGLGLVTLSFARDVLWLVQKGRAV